MSFSRRKADCSTGARSPSSDCNAARSTRSSATCRSSLAGVRELETAQVGDVDEHRKAIRVRWTVEKNDRSRHLELPDDLFEALLATLPPREDRDLEAPLFPDLTDARLRTAITRACNATGTPHFSPH
jgi:integrase